ncbi:MAG: hypothetical protein LQ350_004264 [Teloschistes chrysophthalmus]|nr:MAG: hypothetical protein LQ350_004264 [Niorma chrysophthalma]
MQEIINKDLKKVHECEVVIGYTFKDPPLLWKALQVDDAFYDIRPKTCNHHDVVNKNLALVGIKIVHLLLVEDWYRSEDSTRTALYKLKRDLESTMSSVAGGGAGRWQLCRFLIEEPKEKFSPEEMAIALCCGIIGAIYFDGGMEEAKWFLERLERFEPPAN